MIVAAPVGSVPAVVPVISSEKVSPVSVVESASRGRFIVVEVYPANIFTEPVCAVKSLPAVAVSPTAALNEYVSVTSAV